MRFSKSPVRILAHFFIETDRLVLKGTWNCKGQKSKKHPSKAEREYPHCSGSQLPTKQQQSKHGAGAGGHINQWNWAEKSEVKPCVHASTISRNWKTIQWWNDTLQKVVQGQLTNWSAMSEKEDVGLPLTRDTKWAK